MTRRRRAFPSLVFFGSFGSLVCLVALAASLARAGEPPPDKPAGLAFEAVTLTTDDGMSIVATYWPAATAPPPPPPYDPRSGKPPPAPPPPPMTPAIVLVHGEGSSKSAFDPILSRLIEHHVSSIAIDLRGCGASEMQGGKHLGGLVSRKDPDLFTSMHYDVKAAVRWLVKTKGHDPARIGAIGASLGASVVLDAARLNPEDWSVVMLLTPQLDYPGMTVDDWMKTMTGPVAGRVQIVILSSVEDGDKGPRKLLYTLEYARDAPPKTPSSLKLEKRRGVFPRTRFLPETGATGTAMFATVPKIDAWIAAWFAREWGTYPNTILFDGAVEDKYDLRDPSWANGLPMPVGSFTGHALRWGRRIMVGSEVPMDVKAVRVRTREARGESEVGQYAELDIESGVVTAVPMQHSGARHPPMEIQVLRLGADPGGKGIDPQNPSFEAEIRLPVLPGTGPYQVTVSWGYVTTGGAEVNETGVDPSKPETWRPLPDSEEPTPEIHK